MVKVIVNLVNSDFKVLYLNLVQFTQVTTSKVLINEFTGDWKRFKNKHTNAAKMLMSLR